MTATMMDYSKPLRPEAAPPRPDAVLFDWDGTLIDGFALIRSGYQLLSQNFDLPPLSDSEIGAYMRRSARDLFPEMFGERAEEAARLFSAHIAAHHLDILEPIAGSVDFLELLLRKDIPMGVVSNRNHEWLIKEIPHLGWKKYFPAVVGAGIAAHDKPAPDPLILARSDLGLPEEGCVWYVGDSETDMQAAISAGMVPVFIGHGLRNISDCHNANIFPYLAPDFALLIRSVEF